MHEKLEKKTEESINKILEEGLNTNNLDHLYKLAKINHIAKEEENMNNYGNYSNKNFKFYDRYNEITINEIDGNNVIILTNKQLQTINLNDF